ncbi:dienelactone hydrolase family protein, partial [Escherichia coli]|nr:dienelactone hydrolase family protein [Escherichia coli]
IIVYPDAGHAFNADYRPSYHAESAKYKCISICYELSGSIGGINDCCAKRLV